ncbi:MAG: hypothetical protein IJ220_05580 [Clostridia bacterium]|nr:hypothetical protein [Clostridia bacterium]
MKRAEQVRRKWLCNKRNVELYYELTNAVDTRVIQMFDALLDIFEQNANELIFSDLCLFQEKTLDIKEYSIHEDGFYHFEKKILHFEKNVNVEIWMNELKCYIEKHDGYFAKKLPYQKYYNEPLTYYLQIGIK